MDVHDQPNSTLGRSCCFSQWLRLSGDVIATRRHYDLAACLDGAPRIVSADENKRAS
jgi:hypothetical protein